MDVIARLCWERDYHFVELYENQWLRIVKESLLGYLEILQNSCEKYGECQCCVDHFEISYETSLLEASSLLCTTSYVGKPEQ